MHAEGGLVESGPADSCRFAPADRRYHRWGSSQSWVHPLPEAPDSDGGPLRPVTVTGFTLRQVCSSHGAYISRATLPHGPDRFAKRQTAAVLSLGPNCQGFRNVSELDSTVVIHQQTEALTAHHHGKRTGQEEEG